MASAENIGSIRGGRSKNYFFHQRRKRSKTLSFVAFDFYRRNWIIDTESAPSNSLYRVTFALNGTATKAHFFFTSIMCTLPVFLLAPTKGRASDPIPNMLTREQQAQLMPRSILDELWQVTGDLYPTTRQSEITRKKFVKHMRENPKSCHLVVSR